MIFSKISEFVHDYKKDLIALLFFIFVGVISVLYSFTLPFSVNGDNYVILLANKAINDVNYPDREMILNLDFRPYLYPDILQFFSEHFFVRDYTFILLFLLVTATGLAGYAALRILGFSRSISVSVSLIALFPRNSIGSEIWGVFTYGEVLGRTFGLSVLWLLSAWFIKRKHENKPLWPVFAVAGFATYIHPVSLVFFCGMLFLIVLYRIVVEKEYASGFKHLGLDILAFSVCASALIFKIWSASSKISTREAEKIVGSKTTYAEAVISRIRWDFPPASTLWLRHVAIVSAVFIAAAIWAYFEMKRKKRKENSLYRVIFGFSVPLIVFSVYLSIFIPSFQVVLMREYNWPLVFQQGSRIFKYFYLALFLLLPIALSLAVAKYGLKRRVLVCFTIVGIASSSFGLEWFEFLIGYKNYSENMIPSSLQRKTFVDETSGYKKICDEMRRAGIERNDTVISDEFPLRYLCEQDLVVTLEEGTAYMMSGRTEMIRWYDMNRSQSSALDGNYEMLSRFAFEQNAKYALVSSNSLLEQECEKKEIIVWKGDKLSLVAIKQ